MVAVAQKEIPEKDMRDQDDLLRLDRQVCFPLYAATNLLTRLYGPVLAELGLTYPQYLVLLVLWEQQPLSVGDLGRRLYLDSGTLTPLLKRMEAAGLLTRARDDQDQRRVIVTLTPQGRALKSKAMHVPQTLAVGRSLAELDTLRDQVNTLIETLTAKE